MKRLVFLFFVLFFFSCYNKSVYNNKKRIYTKIDSKTYCVEVDIFSQLPEPKRKSHKLISLDTIKVYNAAVRSKSCFTK